MQLQRPSAMVKSPTIAPGRTTHPRQAFAMTTTNPNTPTPYAAADIAAAVARALRNADDRPRPGPDAGRTPRKYAALSQNFRNGA